LSQYTDTVLQQLIVKKFIPKRELKNNNKKKIDRWGQVATNNSIGLYQLYEHLYSPRMVAEVKKEKNTDRANEQTVM